MIKNCPLCHQQIEFFPEEGQDRLQSCPNCHDTKCIACNSPVNFAMNFILCAGNNNCSVVYHCSQKTLLKSIWNIQGNQDNNIITTGTYEECRIKFQKWKMFL